MRYYFQTQRNNASMVFFSKCHRHITKHCLRMDCYAPCMLHCFTFLWLTWTFCIPYCITDYLYPAGVLVLFHGCKIISHDAKVIQGCWVRSGRVIVPTAHCTNFGAVQECFAESRLLFFPPFWVWNLMGCEIWWGVETPSRTNLALTKGKIHCMHETFAIQT